jgi:hypothetical protein
MQWDQTDQDFLDMLGLLRQHDVDFMVVGAHALAAHMPLRSTGDLDSGSERRLRMRPASGRP